MSVATIVALVHGDWSAAWAAVKSIVSGAVQAVWGVIQVWLNAGILGLFKQAGKLLLGSWRGLWTGVKSLADDAVTAAKNLIQKGFTTIGKAPSAPVSVLATIARRR